MKILLLALLTISSLSAFACGGGDTYELNNDTYLTSYSVVDKSTKEQNYYVSLLNRGVNAFNATDSEGEVTHSVLLTKIDRYIRVDVIAKDSSERKVFKGSLGAARGCNELIELTN